MNRSLVETEWVEIWKFPGTLFTLNCPPNLQPRFSFIGSRIKFLTGDYPNDRFVNNNSTVTWRSHDIEYSWRYLRAGFQGDPLSGRVRTVHFQYSPVSRLSNLRTVYFWSDSNLVLYFPCNQLHVVLGYLEYQFPKTCIPYLAIPAWSLPGFSLPK